MDYDRDKVDEMTLALLWLTSFKDPVGVRAWKGQDWDTMERLHTKGFISDPKSKAKSVVLSEGRKAVKGVVCQALRTQTLNRTSNQGDVATHQILVMEG
jgi:hypothetical protein